MSIAEDIARVWNDLANTPPACRHARVQRFDTVEMDGEALSMVALHCLDCGHQMFMSHRLAEQLEDGGA